MPSSNIAEPSPAPLAIALGDPAGIGPEVTAKAWARRVEDALPPFFAVGDARSVAAVWDGPIALLSDPADAVRAFGDALPIVQVEDAGPIIPGQPNLEGARCALDSLEMAVGLARADGAAGLVTAPVSKTQLYGIGFVHPGQTEFVAERCGVAPERAVMMLAGPTLRTIPITIHVAIKDVPERLTADLIVTRAEVAERGLRRDFGIAHPRLVIAGLNPHAGENGALGREEIDIILPALERLRAHGIMVEGPLSADTMFNPRARAHYDVALCPYHDQALIPIKTLHFDDGVNVTLGLPIIRTSPDHGTAFGIAGKDLAEPGAMIAAIRMAGDCVAHRARAA
jgi:4-hydroxythreonine-4-phosphate dehydrogenase